ncbi:MAG: hypothetical protein WB868_03225 [Xanthobacteraceae bacterium]
MIPYKSNRQYAVPQTLEVRLEIAKAIRKLFDADIVKKFDPTQPRIPAGNSDGGQWSNDAASDPQSIIAVAQRFKLAADPDSYQKCLDLCYPLLERVEPPWSDRNTWDFHKCMNACLGRNL